MSKNFLVKFPTLQLQLACTRPVGNGLSGRAVVMQERFVDTERSFFWQKTKTYSSLTAVSRMKFSYTFRFGVLFKYNEFVRAFYTVLFQIRVHGLGYDLDGPLANVGFLFRRDQNYK